ncbi:sigma-54-dependent transcriptional regulator [Enterococcus sp. HY326]|uniref:sigma-54-dependent transcriptional regulator n=1 Tax=Enterococcus sp. HY326 TaxID=2971265 RepID=UPI00223FDBD3|nr:sigma-54-dependent transcriptional regulator [Enterococcus sp. HY326]
MARVDKVLAFVKKQTVKDPQTNQYLGVTTNEVAEALEIQRTNSSKDLNQLVRDGYIEKTNQRPVRYYFSGNQQTVANPAPAKVEKYVPSYKENNLAKLQPKFVGSQETPMKDIFSRLVGSKGSMKNPIDQAKAAILYPPKGLNCLITGPTGSGKTHFAHAMFEFAKANEVIAQRDELIVFNCADYANNPELLMSHLFGYVKGAFTGANEDKQGIIEQADGGMLFLDEIHRLPPEGQEMIFYFMDNGTYNRLGENSKNRRADVRILGATTEDPSSSLLETFVRRIPINIQLPPFYERPAEEQIDLVRIMMAIEAGRIQRRISVMEDVVKALIGSVTYGNIGQLKSNIQLVCARAFMNQMSNEEITITVEDLSENIRSGLIELAGDRNRLAEMAKYLEPKMTVDPNEPALRFQSDSYELPYNLYDIIGDKAALLKADGLSQDVINQFISTDINIHLKSFYKNHGFTFESDNKLGDFVEPQVIDLTEEILAYATKTFGPVFQQNFIYAFSLHISSLLRKMSLGEERVTNDNIKEMAAGFPKEMKAATYIHHLIEEKFSVTVAENEIYYLTVLLISLKHRKSAGRVGVVIAAHGISTASSMAQVVNKLLGTDRLQAVDMPLDMSPTVAYEKLKQKVVDANEGNGVLLLVDMGSLTSFADNIRKETGVMVRSLDMVTTPLVLEAERKASVLGTDLAELFESLKEFQGYGQLTTTNEEKSVIAEDKVILAICTTGEGTAQRIKEIIEKALQTSAVKNIQVATTSVMAAEEKIQELQKNSEIVAVTGILDPKINAPFLPLENFINQDVELLLENLLLENDLHQIQEIELTESSAKQIAVDYILESFTFINGKKIIEPLWQFTDELFDTFFDHPMDYSTYINLVIHLAGAIERIILKETLTVNQHELQEMKKNPAYNKLHQLTQKINTSLHLEVPEVEEFFVLQFINNQV